MVEAPLEQRKYGVQVCKNAITNDHSSHGMISSSKAHTHKRTDQPTHHHQHQYHHHHHQHQHQHHHYHHHHHQEGDADSIGINSADVDPIDVARPRKKTRLLADIYEQIQSKPSGTVHGDLANAHHRAASVIDRKRKVVHMKGRRKSLNGIMGERNR
jgi:G3E family GTPase